MTIQCDNVDLDWIEAEWRRKLELRHTRVESALSDFGGPVARIHFDKLGADWQSEISRIYAELGIALSGDAIAAMHKEMSASEGGAHSQHRQQMADFSAR